MMNFVWKKLNKKGFTLIELIVVIAILGILAAIAIPRLSGFTETARQANDKETAAVAANAMALYCATNDITDANAPADSAAWETLLDTAGLWPAADQALESNNYSAITLSGPDANGVVSVELTGANGAENYTISK